MVAKSSEEEARATITPTESASIQPFCFLTDGQTLSHLIVGALAAAIGVMAALSLAVVLLPAPGSFVGVHSIILPSSVSGLRIEPREKAFVGLALILGFLAALVAISVVRRRIGLSKRTVLGLLSLILLFNVCSNPALNQESGASWALAGLLASVAIAWFVLVRSDPE